MRGEPADKPTAKERPALSVVQPREYKPARGELEGELIGAQLGQNARQANAIFRELRNGFEYADPLLRITQVAIDAQADAEKPLAPQYIAAALVAANPDADESSIFGTLDFLRRGAPAREPRDGISVALDHLGGLIRADRRRQADDMLRANGVDVLDDVRALLEQAPSVRTALLSSSDFVSGYRPLGYLWDGILQRGFFYNLTGQTGAGKTAFGLRFMAHVAQGRPFGGRDVEQGRVLMLAGENPDDVRMRWIALAEQAGFVAAELPVTFRTGLFSIGSELSSLRTQAQAIGGLALVVVDTENAFFTCDFEDENDNRQRGAWGRILRDLTTLPGKPTVLALGHPVKGATDNLLPRGGGAYLAELDGNLTASAQNSVGQIHTLGKFRGPEFAPVPFELVTVTSPQLVTDKGRSIPTVIARPLSDTEHEERVDAGNNDLHRLLRAMLEHESASMTELAVALDWHMKNGDPYKTKVQRLLGKLQEQKLARNAAGVWSLTPSGEREAKRVRS